MGAKQELQQIKKADILIQCKMEEIESLYKLCTNATSTLRADKVGTSGVSDKVGDCVARIVDLQKELNFDIDKLVDLKKQIMKKIERLDGPYMELLYRRYFQHKTWETIAVEMGYTYQWVCELHGKALREYNLLDKS